MTIVTSASAAIAAQNTYTSEFYVPQGAKVAIGIAGTWAGNLTLEVQWNQTGSYVVQKTFTANPTEGEHFSATRACNIRIGFATGAYTSGTANCDLGFDYPIG